jgi:hypothetical protein
MHTASYHSPYIPEYVGNHPAVSVASASQLKLPGNSLRLYHRCNKANSQKGANMLHTKGTSENSPKLAQSIALCQSRSTSIDKYPTLIAVFFIQFYFLCNKGHFFLVFM